MWETSGFALFSAVGNYVWLRDTAVFCLKSTNLNCTTWWKYCLQDKCKRNGKRTCTMTAFVFVFLRVRYHVGLPVLCLCEPRSAGVRAALSTVTVAYSNWEASAGLRSQHSAEVLLVSCLLYLDESCVYVKSLHSVKFSKDVLTCEDQTLLAEEEPE